MGQLLLFIVVALVVAAIVFGVTVMVSGGDPGLTPVEPDGKALPLPNDRPLAEDDVFRTRFDTVFRGYRMAQVDQALQRAAYDIGYKTELIGVLEAEVTALRDGRTADADVLRRAREVAVAPASTPNPAEAAGSPLTASDAPSEAAAVPSEPVAGAAAPPSEPAAVPAAGAAGATTAEAPAQKIADKTDSIEPGANESDKSPAVDAANSEDAAMVPKTETDSADDSTPAERR